MNLQESERFLVLEAQVQQLIQALTEKGVLEKPTDKKPTKAH